MDIANLNADMETRLSARDGSLRRAPNMTQAPTLDSFWQPEISDRSYDSPQQLARLSWLTGHTGGNVLDVGCGHGYPLGTHIRVPSVGVDIDRQRISHALARSESEPDGWGRHEWYVMDLVTCRHWPWGDATFETVWLAEVLEHQHLSNARFLISEGVRCARGRLLTTIPWMGEIGESYLIGDCEADDHRWYATPEFLPRLLDGFTYTTEILNPDELQRFIGIIVTGTT